jgi:hypothetical protein
MNKLRITFRSCPREVFVSTLSDLSVQFPVVSVSLNGEALDSNIDLVYSGREPDQRRIVVKEYDADLTKNYDKLVFTLDKRTIDYEQIPGLGYQCQTEDAFLSDAEYTHITSYSSLDFCCAEVMLIEYSEDEGATWNSWKYSSAFSYMVDGGLFNGKELASLVAGLPEPSSTREQLTVEEMQLVASQLRLPYTNEGMPILDKQDLGFDSVAVINYYGNTDVSSMLSAQDAQLDQTTVIAVYNPS